MKRASLLTAAAIVLATNGFALLHAWRNRSGPVHADIVLTERELPLSYPSDKEDSGVSLVLKWIDPGWSVFAWEWERPISWLDEDSLRKLGFDTSMPPSHRDAAQFYGRQRARRVFVALEYDGPAWRQHVEQADRENLKRAELTPNVPAHVHETETHLVAIDASRDAAELRARHPDRNSIIVVPGVIRISVRPFVATHGGEPARPAVLRGSIQEIPSSIHVPRPFSDGFRRLKGDRAQYRVHIRSGASFEPWITAVEFGTAGKP